MSARAGLCLTIAAAALEACAVGPRYRAPASVPSATGPFVTRAAALAAEPLPPHWWRLYRDPVLDGLVQRALTENQDLKVASANLAYAQGLLQEATAGRYPSTQVSAGPSYGRSATDLSAGRSAHLTWAAGFIAAYQVDLFGRIRRAVEAASANAEGLEATQDATRVTVAGETASAYAAACGYGAQIAVARRSLALVKQTYDLVAIQRNAGALSDFDVDREAVLLEQARAAIPPLEGQRRASLFTLAALVGATPAELPADAAACQSPPTLTQALPVGDGAALLRRRPDLRAAERQLAAATARIGVATADLYPTVTLAGSVSSAASTLGGVFGGSAVAYGLGGGTSGAGAPPLISWSFPNISLARAHMREARAQASGALATFDGAVLTALKEAEQALAVYAAELDHRAALAAARDRAAEALTLAKIQYQAGAASFLDQLQAEATAVAADQALAVSDQAISADQVAVFQALGGGWEDAPPIAPPENQARIIRRP